MLWQVLLDCFCLFEVHVDEEKETLPDGLEPSTLRLTAARSNQLSYGRPVLSFIHSLIKLLISLHKQTNALMRLLTLVSTSSLCPFIHQLSSLLNCNQLILYRTFRERIEIIIVRSHLHQPLSLNR